jgi:hypothetical protein
MRDSRGVVLGKGKEGGRMVGERGGDGEGLGEKANKEV